MHGRILPYPGRPGMVTLRRDQRKQIGELLHEAAIVSRPCSLQRLFSTRSGCYRMKGEETKPPATVAAGARRQAACGFP